MDKIVYSYIPALKGVEIEPENVNIDESTEYYLVLNDKKEGKLRPIDKVNKRIKELEKNIENNNNLIKELENQIKENENKIAENNKLKTKNPEEASPGEMYIHNNTLYVKTVSGNKNIKIR